MGSGASAGVKDEATKLLGAKLLKGGEEVDTKTAFEGKKAIALYFSAHWCPPCRGFTPKLAEWYKKDLAEKGLEVVFISSDQSEADFTGYCKEQPWLALPFSARDKKAELSKKYKVEGIPSLVIINPEDGSVITKDGRSAVSQDPTGAKLPWIPPTFQEALPETFLKGSDTVGKDAIAGKTLGLYFSAHWCPPCRAFTPQLAEWYKGMKGELGDKFEIIFCSGDKDEAAMTSYYAEQCTSGGDWLCLPFDKKNVLDPLFQVSGIPTFIIVSPEGKVINQNGRSLISSKAKASDFPWKPPPVGDLESPDGINDTPAMCLMLESCAADIQKHIIKTVEQIAKEYIEKDDPELTFFAATKSGGIATKIRSMCGLESSGKSAKTEVPAKKAASKAAFKAAPKAAPKLERTISSETPTLVLMDIPDNGGYYVGRMARELDGTSVRQMIEDWKAKKLERKQLS